jgi:hypothetical protein
MQGEHRAFDPCKRHVRRHVGADAPVRRQYGPVLDQVICGLAGRGQRLRFVETAVVFEQPPDHVAHFMHIPEGLDALGRRERPDIPIGFLRPQDLGDQVLPQRMHLRIVAVSRELDRRIEQHAEANEHAAAWLLEKWTQEIAIHVELQQVVGDRDVYASSDLAPDGDLAQIKRSQHIGPRGWQRGQQQSSKNDQVAFHGVVLCVVVPFGGRVGVRDNNPVCQRGSPVPS